MDAEATALACSYQAVLKRLKRRGSHTAPFADSESADNIARAFRKAVYVGCENDELFFGLTPEAFSSLFTDHNLLWAPDGDEAFDDGSYIIHFDLDNYVRLIGFTSRDDDYYEKSTLVDLRINSDQFYGVLARWRSAFETELGI